MVLLRGLVPSNPEFSRQNIATDESALESAKKDVEHSRKNGGVDYHLKLSIGDKEYYIYQGKFKIGNEEYRYQVALKDEIKDESAIEKAALEAVKSNISQKNSTLLKCAKDSDGDSKGWTEIKDLSIFHENIAFSSFIAEATKVLGPTKAEDADKASGVTNDKIQGGAQQERYYVSDYDVFSIVHNGPVEGAATVKAILPKEHNNEYEYLGKFGGEVADKRDILTIDAINAQLLGYGSEDSESVEKYRKDLSNHYDIVRTFQPIQHAAAAALQFNNPAASPSYPLYAIEKENVVKIGSDIEFAAYLYNLENPQNSGGMKQTCIINSVLSDRLVDTLITTNDWIKVLS